MSAAGPTVWGTVTRLGAHYQLRFERLLRRTARARVWEAVATEDGLEAWFPAQPSWEPRVGGRMELTHADGAVTPGMITAIDPPHTFSFVWGVELMRFELLEHRHGTLLVFNHMLNATDKPDPARYAAGWQVCLETLDHLLLSTAVPSAQRWQRAYEHYTVAFAPPPGLRPSGAALLQRDRAGAVA